MSKIDYKTIKWEDIPERRQAEFRMLFYASLRLVRRLERKLLQMAEGYKADEQDRPRKKTAEE